MLIYCTYPVDVQCIFLHGQQVSPSTYFKLGQLEEQRENSEFCRIFTLHGLLAEHRYQHSAAPLAQLSTLDINRHFLVRDKHLSPRWGRQRCQCVLSLSLSLSVSLSLSLCACLSVSFNFHVLPGALILTACFSPKVLSFLETVAFHLLFNISLWGVSGCCCYRVCYRDWGFGDLHEKQCVCCMEADVKAFELKSSFWW